MLYRVLLALLLPCAASAQVLYGSLTGNVTDSTNAALAGASAEARNTATGIGKRGRGSFTRSKVMRVAGVSTASALTLDGALFSGGERRGMVQADSSISTAGTSLATHRCVHGVIGPARPR